MSPRSVAFVAAVVTAASVVGGCGADSPGSAGSPALDDAQNRIIDTSLPPVPSVADADALPTYCEALDPSTHHHMIDESPGVDSRAADGTYERTFEGLNPRVEVSAVPFDQPPTEAEQVAADRFVAEVRAVVGARGWRDPAEVVRSGYRPFSECNPHYVNVDAMFDGRTFDPELPEFVMLEPGEDGRLAVTGVMFVAPDPTAHGPQRFGALGVWHYHRNPMCSIGSFMLVTADTENCPKGTERFEHTPEMFHVRLDGANPFDSSMRMM